MLANGNTIPTKSKGAHSALWKASINLIFLASISEGSVWSWRWLCWSALILSLQTRGEEQTLQQQVLRQLLLQVTISQEYLIKHDDPRSCTDGGQIPGGVP